MRTLGIETSCDDTAAAIYDHRLGLLAHARAGQLEVHQLYGGIVPELAARDHIKTLLPLIDYLIHGDANQGVAPDAVAYTAGPGLAGALLVGASVGVSLARGWGVPAIGVHHLEGHLLAPLLEDNPPPTPLLALLVSGGHTMLVDVGAIGEYRIIGATLDDAAGEAFDKTAQLLGLGFPGGPAIARAAEDGRSGRFTFTRPMINRGGLDFSFSGLKTQVRTVVGELTQHDALDAQTIADIALAFESTVVETLVIKCMRALRAGGRKRLVVSGGVGANARLRERMRAAAQAVDVRVFYPRAELCTDNGAMIALAGHLRLQRGACAVARDGGHGFDVRPRWSIEEIDEVV